MSNRELVTSVENTEPVNPLDFVESFLEQADFVYQRQGDDELCFQVPGDSTNHQFRLVWTPSIDVLNIFSWADTKVQAHQRPALLELLSLINVEINLGSFYFNPSEGMPVFRYTLMLPDIGNSALDQIQVSLETITNEVDRFFPAFQYVLWGGKSPAEAVAIVLMEPQGEA